VAGDPADSRKTRTNRLVVAGFDINSEILKYQDTNIYRKG